MNGLTTMLAERVESLLPQTAAAACYPYSAWCSSYCDEIKGSCFWLHRNCHTTCRGYTCSSWHPGFC